MFTNFTYLQTEKCLARRRFLSGQIDQVEKIMNFDSPLASKKKWRNNAKLTAKNIIATDNLLDYLTTVSRILAHLIA